jgi:hypothetical protein
VLEQLGLQRGLLLGLLLQQVRELQLDSVQLTSQLGLQLGLLFGGLLQF